jgi:hypothetical protein
MWFAQAWNSNNGLVRISKLTGAVGSETISPGRQFPQSPESWWGGQVALSGGWAPQGDDTQTVPATTYINANDHRMQNLVLRGTSLWAVHTVFEPTTHFAAGTSANSVANPVNHSAIQWWQINSTIETQAASVPIQRGLIEDTAANNCHNGSGGLKSLCTPNGTFYAFPNIAVNDLNDVLIGFSRFNALAWAGAAYAYRDHTDLPNTFRDPFLYKAGEGRYAKSGGGAAVRWGDYSSALVDPNNDRSFWTAQEYAAPRYNNNASSAWSTYWAQVHSLTPRIAFNISGGLIYGTDPAKLVPGVLMSATGATSVSDNSDLAGGYLLNNLNSNGVYTVTPTKTGNINGITPFDATLVLRCVAAGASCTLTANQKLAANANGSVDVSNNPTITPFDATLILRFVAANAQTSNTGQVGNWTFSPASRLHTPLLGSLLNQNFTTILIGEVNGSWN